MASTSTGDEPSEPGLCRCCMTEGTFKTMEADYSWRGHTENYSQMMLDAFDLRLIQVNVNGVTRSRLICGLCVCRLRDACSFRKQLRDSEDALLRLLHSASNVNLLTEVKVEPKLEPTDNAEQKEISMLAGFSHGECDHRDEGEIALSDPEDDVPLNTIPQAKPKVAARASSAPRLIEVARASSKAQKCKISRKSAKRKALTKSGDNKLLAGKTVKEEEEEGPTHKPQKRVHRSAKRNARCESSNPKILTEPKEEETQGTVLREPTLEMGPFQTNPDTTCSLCGKTFTTAAYLKKHIKKFHDNLDRLQCSECQLRFLNPWAKTKHSIAVHGLQNDLQTYKCNICNEEFDTRLKRSSHMKESHKRRGRPCSHCKERFTTPNAKERHMRLVHGIKETFPCGACDKTFRIKVRWRLHQRDVHLMERNFACSLCDMKFFSKSGLRGHMVMHNGEREHECEVCKKSFRRRRTLLAHARIHTGDKRKVCNVCGQAFVQRASLKYHMARHHPGA